MIRYKLTDETKIVRGVTVHRILWLSDNRLGGWIANPECLPQDGTAVLYDDATILNGNFRDGTFLGGEFWGGTFLGGTFLGGEFWSSPSCAQRSDGYMFVAKMVDGELRIWAGCRNFSWDEAVAHWGCQNHHHHAESMRIIEFLRAQEESACK